MKTRARFLDPRFLVRLWEAGAVGRREAVGFVAALPSLIGRGPSLGTASQINARALGSKTAIVDRNGSLTWSELDRRANRLARALIERDLPRDATVATLLRNGREAVEAMLGTQKLGLSIAPLNTWATPGELRRTLDRARPSLLIFDDLHESQVRDALGDGAKEAVPYESLLDGQPGSPPIPLVVERGTPRVVIHTSGTTGAPKSTARSIGEMGTQALIGLLSVVPYRRDDVILCPAPLFHSFGLLTFSVATLLGATLVLPERFDPEESLALIDREEVTAASFLPVMVRRILSLPPDVLDTYQSHELRIVLTSGSVMAPDLRSRARGLFGDILYDLYGSTEAGWIAIATPRDVAEAADTVGRPVPGVEVFVLDEQGHTVLPGEAGSVVVRSDAMFQGYSSGDVGDGQPEAVDTGDVGWLDEAGRLFIEGRVDEMVVIGGENVYPAEVEGVIAEVPGVRDVAVFGVPDEEYGEALAAYIQGDVDPEDVRSVSRAQLSSFKVPRVIEIVDELPRTGTGKIRKRELARARPPGKPSGARRSGKAPPVRRSA